jgi:hypothetical protein
MAGKCRLRGRRPPLMPHIRGCWLFPRTHRLGNSQLVHTTLCDCEDVATCFLLPAALGSFCASLLRPAPNGRRSAHLSLRIMTLGSANITRTWHGVVGYLPQYGVAEGILAHCSSGSSQVVLRLLGNSSAHQLHTARCRSPTCNEGIA